MNVNLDEDAAMTMHTIAVVIPSYNRAHILLEAVGSVRAQTVRPQRLIIVDDGSTDLTGELLAELEADWQGDIELVVVRQPNGGVSAARNAGIARAEGCRWIAFLDSDDLWPADFLARAVAMLATDDSHVGWSADWQDNYYSAQGGELVSSRLYTCRTLAGRDLQGPSQLYLSPVTTSGTLVRRDIAVAVGGFDVRLRYGEDKHFFMKVSMHGRWGRSAEVQVLYRNYLKNTGVKQLSDHPHQNSRLRYARVMQRDLIDATAADNPMRASAILPVWKAWYRAGRHLDRHGHPAWAAAYYWRAALLRPFSKAILRVVACMLRSRHVRSRLSAH